MLYLKKAIFEDVGPLAALSLELPFSSGVPKPVCIVGENGKGKTIFLSHVIDAISEFAAIPFTDILPMHATGHAFFKISGGVNTRRGATKSLSFLDFRDGEKSIQYLDRAGQLS